VSIHKWQLSTQGGVLTFLPLTGRALLLPGNQGEFVSFCQWKRPVIFQIQINKEKSNDKQTNCNRIRQASKG
jgi:hypothetical protein